MPPVASNWRLRSHRTCSS